MKQKRISADDVRGELIRRMAGRTQIEVAREIGIPPQNLSVMVKGAPIGGKVLSWLGYRRVVEFERVA
jgi:tRNA threonylcarbamoyladenosine modification (KEOPS) complex Cgi121 subunit